MRNVLIVHDDSIISRVAYLLEQRIENIKRCEAILNGDDQRSEYLHVNKDGVRQMLDSERWALADLLEDIEDGMFDQELRDIFSKYVTARKGRNGDA